MGGRVYSCRKFENPAIGALASRDQNSYYH